VLKPDRLSRAEGDDAANRIVGGDTHRDAIAWHHFDTEAAHAAAQLSEYFVSCIALHAVESAGVHRDHCSLHVNQIVFAQYEALSPFKAATSVPRRVVARKSFVI
jgi:hypothetical protein